MPAPGVKVRFQFIHEGDIAQALENIKVRVKNKILREAITKACRPLVYNAKRRAPTAKGGKKDGPTGLLRESITFKVVRSRKTKAIVGIIGSRRDIRGYVGNKKRVPANYAHLVEFGHRIATPSLLSQVTRYVGGKLTGKKRKLFAKGGFVEAKPFMRPAWEAGRRQAADTIRREVMAGIDAAAKRASKRKRSIYA